LYRIKLDFIYFWFSMGRGRISNPQLCATMAVIIFLRNFVQTSFALKKKKKTVTKLQPYYHFYSAILGKSKSYRFLCAFSMSPNLQKVFFLNNINGVLPFRRTVTNTKRHNT
jgi:hypothetical protein